jgi:hypothetical protein
MAASRLRGSSVNQSGAASLNRTLGGYRQSASLLPVNPDAVIRTTCAPAGGPGSQSESIPICADKVREICTELSVEAAILQL